MEFSNIYTELCQSEMINFHKSNYYFYVISFERMVTLNRIHDLADSKISNSRNKQLCSYQQELF